MNISSLQARVRSLRRQMALPYAQLMIQRMSNEVCDQWAVARALKRTLPSPWEFVRKVAKAGFRLPTFTSAVGYLEACNERRNQPYPDHLLRLLLPWASYSHAVD